MTDAIIGKERSNLFKLTVTLLNHQDPEFALKDIYTEALTITQDFSVNTTDDIQLSAQIAPEDVQKLITKQSDLYADVLIEYVESPSEQIDLDEKPIVLRYKVLLHDLSGLTKRYGVTAFQQTDQSEDVLPAQALAMAQVQMQLIGEEEYKVNKSAFLGTAKNVTPEDFIKYASSVMGAKKVNVVTPDNTTKYQHLNIPPQYSGFKSVFEYLQSKYGVYANGFRQYLTNGTLYIYPPYNMKSERTPKLTVLRLSENTALASANYHDYKDKDLTIVTSSPLTSQTLSNVGSENEGNTLMFVRSDGILDGQVSKKGSGMELTNISATLGSRADSSISKGSAVPKYADASLNVFKQGSTFAKNNTEIMTFTWDYSRINSIEPGMPITFVYDEKDVVMSKTGIVEMVSYQFLRLNRTFRCSSEMGVRVDPTAVPYES
jgi:hypothetical protein